MKIERLARLRNADVMPQASPYVRIVGDISLAANFVFTNLAPC